MLVQTFPQPDTSPMGKCPSGMCLVGEMSLREVSAGEESVGEMSIGDVSGNHSPFEESTGEKLVKFLFDPLFPPSPSNTS